MFRNNNSFQFPVPTSPVIPSITRPPFTTYNHSQDSNMKKPRHFYSALLGSLVLLGFIGQPTPAFSQTAHVAGQFVLNVDHPFVYAKFDHIGPGAPRSEDEPKQRVWLRLVNNCRVPIAVRANGVPDESPKDEIGVEYDVVANPEIFGVVSDKPEDKIAASQQKSEASTNEKVMPRGYMEEVGSLVTIEPGSDILFSLPVNHLSEKWHIEIPFEFEVPKGKGPHDSVYGGEPVLVLQYNLWDLPPKSRADIPKN